VPDHSLRTVAADRRSYTPARDDPKPGRSARIAREGKNEKMGDTCLAAGGPILNTIEIGAGKEALRLGEAQAAYFL